MRYSLVALVWLGLITHVTVSGLAPAFLNADVILNSVMSLQNITPFYWGQNRLLNVVPLLAWPLRDPALNLLAILYLNTGLYYLVLWIFARGAVTLTAVRAQSREWLARLGAGLKHLAPAHVQQVHVRSRKLQSGR